MVGEDVLYPAAGLCISIYLIAECAYAGIGRIARDACLRLLLASAYEVDGTSVEFLLGLLCLCPIAVGIILSSCLIPVVHHAAVVDRVVGRHCQRAPFGTFAAGIYLKAERRDAGNLAQNIGPVTDK